MTAAVTAEAESVRRASVELFTHKRGLLAAVGHDLCLSVDELELELVEGAVRGWFALASLRVRGAIKRGQLVPSEPSDADRRAILETVRREILDVERYPRAELSGQVSVRGGQAELRGELRLRGVGRPLVCAFGLGAGPSLRIALELVPSQWGIAPYAALGGALKLQDRVGVQVELEVDAALRADPARARARWATTR